MFKLSIYRGGTLIVYDLNKKSNKYPVIIDIENDSNTKLDYSKEHSGKCFQIVMKTM